MDFANYTKILLSALLANPKAQDVIAKKMEILNSIYEFHNIAPTSTLFIGFNPAILATKGKIAVTAVDTAVTDYLNPKTPKPHKFEIRNKSRYNITSIYFIMI
jgi:hypothetical protein